MTISLERVTDLPTLLALERVKPDAFLGTGPVLGWGRIYGGQVVAQALRAAALTVEAPHRPHSLHAYFVRAGNERQPVLYEVEEVRDGRSFTTRQVVAYQAGGAILNLIASFQGDEESEDVQSTVAPAEVPPPQTLAGETTDLFMDHRVVRYDRGVAAGDGRPRRRPRPTRVRAGLPLRREPPRRGDPAAFARRPVGRADDGQSRPRGLVPSSRARRWLVVVRLAWSWGGQLTRPRVHAGLRRGRPARRVDRTRRLGSTVAER
jgi:hypothetical protein